MNLREFKQQYPAYADVPEDQLAKALYEKHYKDQIPWDEFATKIGLGPLNESNPVTVFGHDTGLQVGPKTGAFLTGANKKAMDYVEGAKQIFGMADHEGQAAREEQLRQVSQQHPNWAAAGEIATDALGMATVGRFLPGAALAKNVGGAAAAAGAQYGDVGERARSAALAGAGGAIGSGLGYGLGKIVKPVQNQLTKASQHLATRAQETGLKLSPGQATGSQGLQRLEASMESFPLTSSTVMRLKDANQQRVNQIVAKSFGEKSNTITEDVLGRAAERIGKAFDDVADDTIVLDDAFKNDLGKIFSRYTSVWGGKGDKEFANLMSDAADDAFAGAMPGSKYTLLRSQLSKRQRALLSGESKNPELADAIRQMTDALDDAVERSVPNKAPDLMLAREQWKNLLLAEDAKVGENVSASKLAQLLRSKDRRGFTRGYKTNDLYTAARFADRFRPVVGDSGTATRSALPYMMPYMLPMAGYALGEGTGVGGMQGAMAAAAPWLLAKGYMSRPGQAYLTQGLLGRASGPTSQGIRRLIPPAMAGGLLAEY